MTWDRPLALILALLLPVIIVLHLLSRRRRTLVVPSLFLWDRLLDKNRRSLAIRRLIANLLLLLQLLIVASLVLSLSGPRPHIGRRRINQPTVMLLDVSASMATKDSQGQSRLDAAVDLAMDLVRKKSLGSEVMILSSGATVESLGPFMSSRRELLTRLRSVGQTDTSGAAGRALRSALSLASGRENGQVMFFTDGAFPDPGIASDQLHVYRFGESSPNLGITGFSVRNTGGMGREVLVTVESYADEPMESRLEISFGDQRILEEDLLLPSRGTETRSAFWRSGSTGIIQASLDLQDGLPADNVASADLPAEGRIRVALLSPGNWFLQTVLGTHPNVDLDVLSGPEVSGHWDLFIADRLLPSRDPGCAIFSIYPQETQSPLPLVAHGMTGPVVPTSWDRTHPITMGADFSRISIASTTQLGAPESASVLVNGPQGPLLLAGDDGTRRWVATAFDLLQSSLPFRSAFPIVMAGILEWTVPGDPDQAGSMILTGEPWVLPSEFRNQAWSVQDPSGRTREQEPTNIPVLTEMNQTGLWIAQSALGNRVIGVNLLDSQESNLEPRWDYESPNSGDGIETSSNDGGGRSLTALLLLLAVAILSTEWWLQTRIWRRG